ncbi:AAA domain-containing protein [Clostridium muellerianum]|uniref:AAA domain-containing protein n=1 Tax=Clostridium muellerianum TaxID=2716538 RepID=UPI001FADDE89|nr:AAA domain-containing protein [Clostridium muellerianum]
MIAVDGCSVNKISKVEWWLEVTKKCKSVYDQLFKLYLEVQKKAEGIEIVWGHALLVWRVDNEKIVHPVVTTRMKLSFDVKESIFHLTPISPTCLETGIFEGINVSNLHSIMQMENEISSTNVDPRSMNNIKNILEDIISYLSPSGEIKSCGITMDKLKPGKNPLICDSPVILVRKNNVRLWQKEIININNKIDNGYVIPETVKALVCDKRIEQSDADAKEWDSVGEDILFPLDTNFEQKQVVKKLCENYGVVVQGPPGTGKSHTIVNLICHLLAHGKSVLVTSQTDKALRVLVDMIPEHIKPLCMSVLGNDSNSLKELNEAVRKITDNLSVDTNVLSKEIETSKKELEECRKKQNHLYNRLTEIKNTESESIKYKGQYYKMIDIAKWVRENRKQYSWIEDDVKYQQAMPLSKEEFLKLKELLKSIDKEEKFYFDSIKGLLDKIPTGTEIYDKVSRFNALNKNYKENMKLLNNWRIPDNNRCDYGALLSMLKQCKDEMADIENGGFKNMLELYYSSKIAHDQFMDVVFRGNNYLLMLSKDKNKLKNYNIEIPSDVDIDKLSKDFDVVYNNFNSKGKIKKIFRIIHSEYNYIFTQCKVNSIEIENLDQASVLKVYIHQQKVTKDLKILWNDIAKEYGDSSQGCKEELEVINVEQNIKKLNSIIDWDVKCKSKIISLLGRISVPEDINWHTSKSYGYLIECVQAIKKMDEYNELKAYIEVLKKLILSTDKLDELYNAIELMDVKKIREQSKKIEYFKVIKSDFVKLDEFINRIAKVCPITAGKIIDSWEHGLKSFEDFECAWKWCEWNSLLKDVYKLNLEFIEEAIEENRRREKIIIRDIVSKKTWYNQILRTTEAEKRSLFAWLQAIKRIGKGTGKMVSEYRKIAQDEMEKCKETIPVWIMPMNRVIENIKLSRKLFDVIICDESSQSDIFSICALMRAKKAVVVGDDKQISPETVGIDHGVIQGLINNHLKDIPQREWFDLQTSLYDTALRVFPNRLILREHFRCVPEIIGFSNMLCYSNEIKPLRYPKFSEVLYPPIIAIKAENGYREHNKPINVPEAELLVSKIVECCKDRKYKGMTMGVISLLGDIQSELIENMIREKIGEEEMIKRRLVCGDAYSFQGDERDIMFLSMVIGNNVKFAPLTRESDIRRFNVAASRARNQMWLFYSVELEDLNKSCVRYSLLNYCLNYEKYRKRDENLEWVFQSKFQRDIYNGIKDKGYNVMPQIKIGGYKVDFVIEGERNRAAVICDEGMVDKNMDVKKNMETRLSLERIGWSFFRIRGSEFYYNPEKVMEKLCNRLNRIGIGKYDIKRTSNEALKVV